MGREILNFGAQSAEFGTQGVHFWDGRPSFICQKLGSSYRMSSASLFVIDLLVCVTREIQRAPGLK